MPFYLEANPPARQDGDINMHGLSRGSHFSLSPLCSPSGSAPTPITSANVDDVAAKDDAAPNPGAELLIAPVDRGTPHVCRILNAPAGANCKSGPGTSYSVVHTAKDSELFSFPCFVSGEGITMNGLGGGL
ncbi:hypothetical protein VTG60DRAFT_6055 [Thermothelomyces hinnuleus]